MRRHILVLAVLLAVPAPARAADPPVDLATLDHPSCLRIADDGSRHELPLVKSAVHVDVRGPIAQVELVQTFANPSDAPIEAVYVFPLPHESAVGGMQMTIGTRTIRAVIKRRDEARKMYEAAKEEGKTAALLEQERPNIFTQSVANILPGEQIEVALTYDVLLSPIDDLYELALPTVVGPRYNPASVADADRISPKVAVPGHTTGNVLTVDLDVDAALPITELASPTHGIVKRKVDRARYQVTLDDGDMVANKDFVLRWRVEVESPALAVLAHKDAGSDVGYATLMVQAPPAAPDSDEARELVFIVDTSGSMSGEPMALGKRAMRYALERLDPGDQFRIFVFSNGVAGYEEGKLFDASRENVRAALSWINGLEAGGGTEMIHAVKAALSGPPDGGRTRYVCFLTDGYIGNENEIFAEVDARLDPASHLFSFGVGASVNRFLIDGLAEHGAGVAHYFLLDEEPGPQIEEAYRQIDTPALQDLQVTWTGPQVIDTVPAQVPSLFAGQPVVVTVRYKKGGKGSVVVTGTRAGRDVQLKIPLILPDDGGDGAVLGRLWARRRIEELEYSQVSGTNTDTAELITQIALAHSLMSQYTSFVAIEQTRRTNGAPNRVDVPTELPEGVTPAAGGEYVIPGEYGENIPVGRTFGAVLGSAAGSQGDAYGGEVIVIQGSVPTIDAGSTRVGVAMSGSTSVENAYYVEGITSEFAPRRRWKTSLDIAMGLDTRDGGGFLALSGSLERRVVGWNALGATATLWERDESQRMLTLLGTLARWAIAGALDLRLGAGAALADGDLGYALQLRLAVPIPLGTDLHPELELRLDRASVLDDDLLGFGAGVGFRF
jgi:Ca-activated chloride channel homolog